MGEAGHLVSQLKQPRMPYRSFTLRDWLKYGLLKIVVSTIYIVSHLYDYAFYPVYCVFQHPWIIRQYKRMIHSQSEVTWTVEDENAIVYWESRTRMSPGIEDIHAFRLDTMVKIFHQLGKHNSDVPCLATREVLDAEDERQSDGRMFQKFILGSYKWMSIGQFKARVRRLILALTNVVNLKPLRYQPGSSVPVEVGVEDSGIDRVAIIAETRADWLVTAFACFHLAIPLVTLYTNLGVDNIVQAINETEATTLFCSAETVDKVKEVLPRCQSVINVVVMDSLVISQRKSVRRRIVDSLKPFVSNQLVFLDDLCGDIYAEDPPSDSLDSPDKAKVVNGQSCNATKSVGGQIDPKYFPRPTDCAIIMYTSGSTGKPKGVVLSHSNLTSAVASLSSVTKFKSDDRYIGYLPLAHVLELLAETTCLMLGVRIGYSSPNTLTSKSTKVKAGCKGDTCILRPTVMCAVPLVLEKIYKSIVETANRQGWAVAELFDFLVKYKMKWQDRGFDTPILNHTLFRRIRYFLGGRVRVILSGGAPLSDGTYSLTRTCLCVPLIQGYGLTETTACAAIVDVRDRSTGRVGAPLPGVQIKLVSWRESNYLTTDKPNPRGEIHIGGPIVATGGYFRQPDQTQESFYVDPATGTRWFRTGDIGEFDCDGILRIVDRCKDLVKLQGGEYISYGKIEPVLKNCPFVDIICVHADPQRDYAIAIIVPAQSESANVPRLADGSYDVEEVVKRLKNHGLRNGLLRFELPQKVIIVNDEWTPDSGLVTAAFKIRRRQIVQKYRAEIDKVYV